tara:strand:+ start:144 stop:1007 length:864 start_codon:yes stop_codon:yes gene_type:complete
MAATVEFNGKKIEDKLSLLVQSDLPWITTKTLSGKGSLASQIRDDLRKEMVATFKNPVPWTLNSLGIKSSTKKDLEAWVFHKDRFGHIDKSSIRKGGGGAIKGNAAADYLRPQVLGGPVFRTRFQQRLLARGFLGQSQGQYMIPGHLQVVTGNRAVRSGTKKLPPGEYQRALWGIRANEDLRLSGKYGKKNYRTAGSYEWVPKDLDAMADWSDELAAKATKIRHFNKGVLPSPGIYKVQKSGLKQVFAMLDNVPVVAKKYQFRQAAQRSFDQNYERIFREKVKEVLG